MSALDSPKLAEAIEVLREGTLSRPLVTHEMKEIRLPSPKELSPKALDSDPAKEQPKLTPQELEAPIEDKFNYAASECGAKVIAANPEAQVLPFV